MTGDEQYREFLYKELIGNIDTVRVAHTVGAFDTPKYCKKYYGDQITYGPWWAFIHLLGDSDLKTEMMKVFHNELWDKLVKFNGNVDFNIMYAGVVDPELAVDREVALAYAMDQLPWMGGNGGVVMGEPENPVWLDEPRRSYTNSQEAILAAMPEEIQAVCPTQDEVDACAAEVEIMGIKMGNLTGWKPFDCGLEGEMNCTVTEGKCVYKQTSTPLPVHLRNYTDYLWQRNPFAIGSWAEANGKRQYAGSDLSVPYYNALRYGFVTESAGQVLGWREVGPCDEL